MSIFPTKIVLATDGSEEGALATGAAVELAEKTGSELHLAYAVSMPWATGAPDAPAETIGASEAAREEARERAQRFLDEQVERIRADGSAVAQAHLRMGKPDEEIVVLSDEIGAGLLVVGSRGLGGMQRALMGSVSDSVVRHAHCPVLVVRPDTREGDALLPTKILLATDGSEEAELAARITVDLAERTGSELHVVHVGEAENEARELLDKQVKRIQDAGGAVDEAHLRLGQADNEILGLAEEESIGLVVMGSRGLGGIRKALMGSASDSVVRHAHCPVLIVRKDGR